MKVLEVGCGRRKLLKDSVGIDIESIHRVIRADAHELPFSDETFNLTLCLETLEHVKNPQQVLNELCRVTKESILISTPNRLSYLYPYRLLHLTQFDYGTPPDFRRLKVPSFRLEYIRSLWYQQILLKRRLRREH